MKIIDLDEENEKLYFVCLEDWSDEMQEAGNHKEIWYKKIKDKGLRVKLAIDEQGNLGGMIQYLPIEYSFIEGEDLYFILCIWVHGYKKKSRRNFQKKGMGKALLKAAEEDVKNIGSKGIAAWGITMPFWMKASWYKKNGYQKTDKNGVALLLWKPFSEDAIAPKWMKTKKNPVLKKNKVTVTCFKNGWCPAMNLVYERAKKVAHELGEKVVLNEIDTFEHDTICYWGISDALYIDEKEVRNGPPPSYKKIKNKILKKMKKLPKNS